ncbi:MAG: YhcH/YjgK/YiaL family protein [Planctomycetales bacterium]|nr:YhcH/YjgK/YiaL family protein [Planctomycetales bacterium]
MILAQLDDAPRYATLASGLDLGFEFLRRPDLAHLPNGRHELDGDRVFALVARELGRGRADSPLEFHRRYLDIQYVISGTETIGWLPTAECRYAKHPFDEEKDLGFFLDRPGTWCRLPLGNFAIFFPSDAHAPLAGSGPVHKVVVKVAL